MFGTTLGLAGLWSALQVIVGPKQSNLIRGLLRFIWSSGVFTQAHTCLLHESIHWFLALSLKKLLERSSPDNIVLPYLVRPLWGRKTAAMEAATVPRCVSSDLRFYSFNEIFKALKVLTAPNMVCYSMKRVNSAWSRLQLGLWEVHNTILHSLLTIKHPVCYGEVCILFKEELKEVLSLRGLLLKKPLLIYTTASLRFMHLLPLVCCLWAVTVTESSWWRFTKFLRMPKI